MRSSLIYLSIIFSLVIAAGCNRTAEKTQKRPANNVAQQSTSGVDRLHAAIDAVKSLHTPMGEPLPGDWLTTYSEDGQTFAEYLRSNPTLPKGKRRVLYIQPLGAFTDTQRKVIALTAKYMEAFFNLPVKLQSEKPLPVIPENARRIHPAWGDRQILTSYLLTEVLRPTLPDDAHALIAFTTSDLFPGEEMNFVFGQASLSERVGVWSLYRLGAPERSADDYRLFLLRTLKLATHETGHMFSFLHCTKYECNMNGTNHLGETDRHPLDACPECMAKICWATDYNPRARYERLAAFYREQGLTTEQQMFEKRAEAVKNLYPD
jgi:archaemetzincin